MTDSFNRFVDYMRISVTDRCNLRCKYCMPHDLPLVSHEEVLRSEEFVRMCRIAGNCGIKNIKITGGEPLVRKDCISLIRDIKALPKIEQVTLTTNAVLLGQYTGELAEIGIGGVNVSLDTLDPKAFFEMTGKDEFDKVLSSILKAIEANLRIKINCVPIRGFNDDQYLKLAELAQKHPIDVRFIEAMPIGFGKDFAAVPSPEIMAQIKKAYPDLRESKEKRGFGPAIYYTSDKLKGSVGFITAVSHGFCESCNRVRLTSEGFLKLCLYHGQGVDFRGPLRGGASDKELESMFNEAVKLKPEKHLFESGIQEEKRGMSRIGG